MCFCEEDDSKTYGYIKEKQRRSEKKSSIATSMREKVGTQQSCVSIGGTTILRQKEASRRKKESVFYTRQPKRREFSNSHSLETFWRSSGT